MRRPLVAVIVSTVLVAGWITLGACSNNKEGERCEVNNNNDDCEDGLICIPKAQAAKDYQNADRCCPPPGIVPTHPACKENTAVAGEGGPGTDSGPTPDAGRDGTADTGTDATDGSTATDGSADADAD
jgi:hypothetical protein